MTLHSFRQHRLSTLRLTPLEIAPEIERRQSMIKALHASMKFKARKLVLLWSLFISAFAGTLLFILSAQWLPAVILLTVLVGVSLLATALPTVINRLTASQRYHSEYEKISGCQAVIDDLQEKAQCYLQRLEIVHGPGFLAMYEDVVLDKSFNSALTMEMRLAMIESSKDGYGQHIDIDDYALLLQELKAQGIPAAIVESSLADSVPAQAANKVAIAYAQLISDQEAKTDLQELRLAATVGLHSRLSFHLQTLDIFVNESWSLAECIFRDCLSGDAEQLKQDADRFQCIKERQLAV